MVTTDGRAHVDLVAAFCSAARSRPGLRRRSGCRRPRPPCGPCAAPAGSGPAPPPRSRTSCSRSSSLSAPSTVSADRVFTSAGPGRRRAAPAAARPAVRDTVAVRHPGRVDQREPVRRPRHGRHRRSAPPPRPPAWTASSRETTTRSTAGRPRTRARTASRSTRASGCPSGTAAACSHLHRGEQLGADHLDLADAEHRRAVHHPGQRADHQQHAGADRPGQRGPQPPLPGPRHEPAHRRRHRVGVRPDQPPVTPARRPHGRYSSRQSGCRSLGLGQRGQQLVAHQRDRRRAHGDHHVAGPAAADHLGRHVLPGRARRPCARPAGRSPRSAPRRPRPARAPRPARRPPSRSPRRRCARPSASSACRSRVR